MSDNKEVVQENPSPPKEKAKHHHHHHNDIAAPGNNGHHNYWDDWQFRAGTVSLLLSLLMQLSYVAFPAYNFSLAIWATVHPFAHRHNTKGTILFISIMLLSCVTDVVWSSLWISGTVFYDMLCVPEKIGILHCDGLQSFPGCGTNRFVMVLFVVNVAIKLVTALSIWKAVAIATKPSEKVMEAVAIPPPEAIQDAPPTAVPIESVVESK